MSNLHDTLHDHVLAPRERIWPSVTATAIFAGIHAMAYIGGVFAMSWRRGLVDTAYGQPLFVWGSIVAAVLLVGFVIFDVRRHDAAFWKVSRWLIGATLVALLGALLSFLFRAAALL